MANGRMGSRKLRKFCKLDQPAEHILRQAMTELGLSARAHDKVLRVGRTIADLAEADQITAEHVAEAIHYRRRDRQL
jgi:magnesium chelatase family protein